MSMENTTKTAEGVATEQQHTGSEDGDPSDLNIKKGLAGVVIAQSTICAVNGTRGSLTYRGYDVGELACHSSYEETIYLLWNGHLPTKNQLNIFTEELKSSRNVDGTVWSVLKLLPNHVVPMDALLTAVAVLSCSEDSHDDWCLATNLKKALSLTAQFPTIIANYYRLRRGKDFIKPHPELNHAANFLYMLHGKEPSPIQAQAMDLAMLLMSEHGFNASTFAARVTSSTLSDMYSAIATAIGTLKGPLHGGANRRAMEMMLEIGDIDNVESYIDVALKAKQRIMGFGHRVYKTAPDPRSAYLRGKLYELCAELGDFHFYNLAINIAETVVNKKGLYPNVDFYAAPLLYLVGVPLELFIPVFAISRVPGWTSHIMEQYENNKLLRPVAVYVGPRDLAYLPIDQRE
ncbi:MAG: citrate/2-methylcitrate synthase [Anaerolineae bacterium]|nr:citrate/2-methylcitrate synthase [Anaerolineae bacterium]